MTTPSSEAPERPVPTSDDPEAPFGHDDQGQPLAPYGLTQEGRPRRSSAGRPPGAATRRPKAAARGSSAPPKRPRAPQRPRPKAAGPDYARGVQEMLQGPMVALTLAGMKRPELLADAAALEIHVPPIAEALGQLAHEKPEVAAMLDRLMAAGPYTALLTALIPLTLQICANHGLIKPGMAGTVPASVLVGALQPPTPEQMAAWAAAADAEPGGGAQSAA